MIKTPLSTVIGGAFWTPGATVIGGASKTLDQLIESLFANNEQGFAYDPNDLTTMFQDTAGTVPVTAVGQPVGLILDKSGNNNHAFATSSATRPILRKNATTGAYYLEFDGSDDFLVTNSIDFTATDEVSVFAGIRKLSDAISYTMLCEFSLNAATSNGAFNIQAPSTSANKAYAADSRGTISKTLITPSYPAPNSSVLVLNGSISAPLVRLRVNAINFDNVGTQGTGNYGNYPLYIGRRGGTTLPFNGHIYSLIGVGRLTTDDETIALEKLISKNTGVTLNV